MPELPEVETTRRGLAPHVEGRQVMAVTLRRPDLRWPIPPEVSALLPGQRIEAVRRRAKYLLFDTAAGSALLHLGMSGSLRVLPAETPVGAHDHVDLALDGAGRERGRVLRFTDPRRFGHGHLLGPGELDPYLDSRIGVEPLGDELTAELIGRVAEGRTVPLKSFLLDQKGIAGIGNIYADEALHRAELHPLSPAGSMRPEHWEALREGIVDALEEGLRNGGASIDDYRDSRGQEGSMQDEFLVHTRAGEECPRCGERINRIVVGGRSTYFCPGCQVRLRRRRRPRRRARR